MIEELTSDGARAAADRGGVEASGGFLARFGERGAAVLFDGAGAVVGAACAEAAWGSLAGREAAWGEWCLLAVAAFGWVLSLSLSGQLKGRLGRSLLEHLPEVIRQVLVCSAAVAVFVGVPLLAAGLVSDLGVLAFGAAAGVVSAPLARLAYYRTAGRGRRLRILVVGAGREGRRAARVINRNPLLRGCAVGFLDAGHANGSVDGLPVLGGYEELGGLLEAGAADAVLLSAAKGTTEEDLVELVVSCDGRGVPVLYVPPLYETTTGRSSVEDVGGLALMHLNRVRLKGGRAVLKRTFDLVLTVAGLSVVWPVLLLVAIAVKVDSPGPVFFTQERVGPEGRRFKMYKFRSMRVDAERLGTWTTKGDPRRTRMGKIMRPLNLDELPQILNVLKGDLSLVGPRPEQPSYAEKFEKTVRRYAHRHRIKGGITGWAQVNGLRGDTSIEERAVYDNAYIENWSLGLDVRILILTFWKAGISAAEKTAPQERDGGSGRGQCASAGGSGRKKRRNKGSEKDRRHAGGKAVV